MAKILKQGATASAIVLSAAIALLGLYVAIIGIPTSYIMETITQEGETITTKPVFQYHYIAGLFYALAAVMIIGGLLYGKLRIAWWGLAFLFVISVLFLFSSGAAVLPVDVVLLVLLIIIQRSNHGLRP